MVAGSWYNQDGLYLQYGVQKAIPEMGGEYVIYGETREIEQYIPLVNSQWGGALGAEPFVSAPPTTFTGTTTAAAAGIQSLTTFFPLTGFAPVTTVASSQYTFNVSQIFIEQVEVDTLIGATGGTTITTGLVVTSPGSPSSSFAQVTDATFSSSGNQILNALPIAAFTTAGQKSIYVGAPEGFTFNGTSGGAATTTGGGLWVGKFVPVISNAITPLPTTAWISTIAAGSFTAGLIKLRIKYVLFGAINQ